MLAFRRVVSRLSPRHRTVPLPLHEERGSEKNNEKEQGQSDRQQEKEGERERHPFFSTHSDVLRVLRVVCCRPRRIHSLDLAPTKLPLTSTLPSAVSSFGVTLCPTTYSSTTLTTLEFRAIAAGRHQRPHSRPKRRSSVASNKDLVG